MGDTGPEVVCVHSGAGQRAGTPLPGSLPEYQGHDESVENQTKCPLDYQGHEGSAKIRQSPHRLKIRLSPHWITRGVRTLRKSD